MIDRDPERAAEGVSEEREGHADTGTAAGVGGVTGAAIGAIAGPVGAVVGAAGGMAAGAIAERMMHGDRVGSRGDAQVPTVPESGTPHQWDREGRCTHCGLPNRGD